MSMFQGDTIAEFGIVRGISKNSIGHVVDFVVDLEKFEALTSDQLDTFEESFEDLIEIIKQRKFYLETINDQRVRKENVSKET